MSIGDYVKVTDTKLFEGLTEEEYFKAYRIIDIEQIPCDDAELYNIEIEGPMNKYLLTNFNVKKVNKAKEINIKENNMKILEEEKPNAVMSDHQKETLADINRIMQIV